MLQAWNNLKVKNRGQNYELRYCGGRRNIVTI